MFIADIHFQVFLIVPTLHTLLYQCCDSKMDSKSLHYMKHIFAILILMIILEVLYSSSYYASVNLGATANSSGTQTILRSDDVGTTNATATTIELPLNNSLSTSMMITTKSRQNNVSESLQKNYKSLYEFAELPVSKFFDKVDPSKRTQCPVIPPNMVGRLRVYQDYFSLSELNNMNFHVKPGGSYSPSYCQARSSVAIIIPFRNREHHLSILLLNLHPFLQKQQRDYTIFIVNQTPGSKFNRAMLMNIGFWEAMKIRKFDCIIFHDVDIIPENDKNVYECPEDNPRHMSVAIDKFNYQLPYESILGGIVAIRWDIFMDVNGYSNVFFGWGGEDDDFSQRLRSKKYIITRYPANIARYQMIKHERDAGNDPNKQRFDMLKHVLSRIDHDGLNSLTYDLKSVELLSLYTQFNVDINQTDVMNADNHSLADFPYTSNRWKPS